MLKIPQFIFIVFALNSWLTFFLLFFGYTAQNAGSWFPNQASNLCPPPAVEVRGLNCWTTREVPVIDFVLKRVKQWKKSLYFPTCLPYLVLFILFCGSRFLSGILFLLPEWLPLTFNALHIYWSWILPAFESLKKIFIFESCFQLLHH